MNYQTQKQENSFIASALVDMQKYMMLMSVDRHKEVSYKQKLGMHRQCMNDYQSQYNLTGFQRHQLYCVCRNGLEILLK